MAGLKIGVEIVDLKEINSYGQKMIECLKLKTSPIAVKLVSKGGEIPAEIKRVDENMTHCQFVDRVRRTGEEFYTSSEDQMCKIGAGTLGLNEIPPEIASGISYYKEFGLFGTLEAARYTVEKIPVLPPNYTEAIMYSSLEKTSFIPDVILIICNPKQVMLLTRAHMYMIGGRLETSFVGIQSLCSEAVVQAYKERKVGIAVCCNGSRSNTNITDEEMIMSVPVELLPNIVPYLKENNNRNPEENIGKISDLSQAKPVEIAEIRKLMPCIADPSMSKIVANMTPPLGGALEILEPLFPRSIYLDKKRSLIIQKDESIITIYSSGRVIVSMVKNESVAKKVLDEIKITINEAIKTGAVPVPKEKVKIEVMEIYKYLPQTNCSKCSEKDCYSFASKLMIGEVTLDRCKLLKEPKYAINKEHLQVLTAYI